MELHAVCVVHAATKAPVTKRRGHNTRELEQAKCRLNVRVTLFLTFSQPEPTRAAFKKKFYPRPTIHFFRFLSRFWTFHFFNFEKRVRKIKKRMIFLKCVLHFCPVCHFFFFFNSCMLNSCIFSCVLFFRESKITQVERTYNAKNSAAEIAHQP